MILNFRKSILYIFCLVHWVGCTSLIELDRVAQVNEVNVELSERGRAVSEGRNLVLEGKQSLKIALLKMLNLTLDPPNTDLPNTAKTSKGRLTIPEILFLI